MHALLVTLMTVGILATVAGFFTVVFYVPAAVTPRGRRVRAGAVGGLLLAGGLALAITTGVAGAASPAPPAHTSGVHHLGYGKF